MALTLQNLKDLNAGKRVLGPDGLGLILVNGQIQYTGPYTKFEPLSRYCAFEEHEMRAEEVDKDIVIKQSELNELKTKIAELEKRGK